MAPPPILIAVDSSSPAQDDGGSREWFVDTRSGDRRMRASCHLEHDVVVLSLWDGPACARTFRLALGDAERLIGLLVRGLVSAAGTSGQPGAPVAPLLSLHRNPPET